MKSPLTIAYAPSDRINAAKAAPRLLWLDLARSIALLGMVVFHLAWDLELFGALSPGTMTQAGWTSLASIIAGSFIFLSGISFVIAHGAGFQPRKWLRRLAGLSAAALLVSTASYVVFPDRYIYFGILHCIAACSVAGALLLRVPAAVLFAMAIAILAVDAFGSDWLPASAGLAFTGLAPSTRPSVDFLPLVPWMAAFVAGMGCAKLLPVTRFDKHLGRGSVIRCVALPGRHSLTVYLVHQPLLLALLWAATSLVR